MFFCFYPIDKNKAIVTIKMIYLIPLSMTVEDGRISNFQSMEAFPAEETVSDYSRQSLPSPNVPRSQATEFLDKLDVDGLIRAQQAETHSKTREAPNWLGGIDVSAPASVPVPANINDHYEALPYLSKGSVNLWTAPRKRL